MMKILSIKEYKNRNKIEQWVCLDGCAEMDEVVWAQLDGEVKRVEIKRDGWFPIGKVMRNGRSG